MEDRQDTGHEKADMTEKTENKCTEERDCNAAGAAMPEKASEAVSEETPEKAPVMLVPYEIEDFGNKKIKVSDTEIRVSTPRDDFMPDRDERFGSIRRRADREHDHEKDHVIIGGEPHEVDPWPVKGSNAVTTRLKRIFIRNIGWTPVREDAGGKTGYVAVRGTRKAAVLALIALLLAILLGVLSAIFGVAPQNVPVLAADMVGITNNNEDVHATITGQSTFASLNDMQWKAGSMEQPCTILNPSANTIDIVPAIYLDYNNDGKLDADEKVCDYATYDGDGKVTAYKMIQPGYQIESVTLDTAPREGTWNCYVYYAALDTTDHHACNPMIMGPCTVTVS